MDNSENASNIQLAHEVLKGAELRDGSITAMFERTGKGKVSYSHEITQRKKLGKDFAL